jgi:hypothetical protein
MLDHRQPAVVGLLRELGLVLEDVGELDLLELFGVGKTAGPVKVTTPIIIELSWPSAGLPSRVIW